MVLITDDRGLDKVNCNIIITSGSQQQQLSTKSSIAISLCREYRIIETAVCVRSVSFCTVCRGAQTMHTDAKYSLRRPAMYYILPFRP